MQLKPAITPSYLKIGFFGNTGTGKTYTAAKILSQFIKEYCPESQLAMFDTEPSSGYIAPMVKQISGKDLLAFSSRSFSDLMEFTEEAIKNKYVVLVDSITHPWRQLCSDYLEAKRSRVKSAGGRENTVKLSLKDWGPLKEIWNTFSEKFVYSPVHFCIIGREGDSWETMTDEEGNEELRKTGVRMKTESEFGYEPSLLVRMTLYDNKHIAFIAKDRFDSLTGKSSDSNPDIQFFKPHFDLLNIGGKHVKKSEGKKIFDEGSGPNWETLKAQREAILEAIKDDMVLAFPGQSANDKKAKIEAIRGAFGQSATWTELESDRRKWTIENLTAGRELLQENLKKEKK